jgi:hypothetical protein
MLPVFTFCSSRLEELNFSLKCEAEKRKHLVIKLIILGIIFSFDDV